MAENPQSAPGQSQPDTFYHEPVHLSSAAREKLYDSVLDSSRLDTEYLTMLALSGLIALFGLLQNSVAVIIGAMLISPLMNPILAAALALLLGDGRLGRRAAWALAISAGGVIALTGLVTWLTPLREVTSEILARTNPNLLDLFIAFLSGVAGTLALRSGPVSLTIIPGVAIAVAVVPPLAVVGYALSTRHGAMAWGGFLLFATNLVAIMISAALVFRLMGFAPRERGEEGTAKLRRRMAVSALVLAVLAVPLVQTLRKAVAQIRIRSDVESVVDAGFQTDHSTVNDLSYSQVGNTLRIQVTLRTTQYFEKAQIGAVEESLRNRFGPETQLLVNQILVAQGGLSAEQMARIKDFISGGVVKPSPKPEPFDLKVSEGETTDFIQRQLDEIVQGTPIRRTGRFTVQLGGPRLVVLQLRLVALEPLERQTLDMLASQLSSKVSSPVEIHGEVELTGPEYTKGFESPDASSGLSRADRLLINGLIGTLLHHPDTRIQVNMGAADPDAESLKRSRLWREVEGILGRSRLEASQWSMQIVPLSVTAPALPAPMGAASLSPEPKDSSPPPTPGRVRCNFMVFQNF